MRKRRGTLPLHLLDLHCPRLMTTPSAPPKTPAYGTSEPHLGNLRPRTTSNIHSPTKKQGTRGQDVCHPRRKGGNDSLSPSTRTRGESRWTETDSVEPPCHPVVCQTEDVSTEAGPSDLLLVTHPRPTKHETGPQGQDSSPPPPVLAYHPLVLVRLVI